MNTIRLVGMTVALLSSTTANAADWTLDTAHTDVSFKVRHMAVSYTRGNFKAVTGTLQLDEKKIENSKVEINIDTTSIDTSNKKRDEHLRSADFFDVKKYPKMTFVSQKVRKQGEGLIIDGQLTIHGKTQSVSLNVDEMSETVKGPYGFYRKGFTARTKIDRRKFGLTWSQLLETGGLMVGNEVSITIEAEFTHK